MIRTRETANTTLWDMAEKKSGKKFAGGVDRFYGDQKEIKNWLKENKIRPYEFNNFIYFFTNYDDAMMFFLRWCGK